MTGHAAEADFVDDLTPLGAERNGNADGTIPQWQGGLVAAPTGYDPARHEVDPFAEDTPMFVIDGQNADEHRAHLTDGQRALLASYSTWHMNVYPTRRSAAFPAFVYGALRHNDANAVLLTEGTGHVRNNATTSPFPRPANGLEAIWNHVLRWRGVRIRRSEGSAAVTPRGRFTLVVSIQDFAYPYAAADRPAPAFDNILFAAKTKTLLPAQLTGRGSLVIETIDQSRDPRKVWRYLPSIRQVVRDPNVNYGLPAVGTDGLRTIDDYELFNGPPDLYDLVLLGKREIYVPYNAYRVHAEDLAASAILGRHHVDPELLRYELHRVWVVEATLKSGARHVYGRRMFYLDEDSWQIILSDSWDLSGQLWRTAEAHTINYYTVPVPAATLYTFYDLQRERYLVEGLDNTRAPWDFSATADPREFSPNALNYYVR